MKKTMVWILICVVICGMVALSSCDAVTEAFTEPKPNANANSSTSSSGSISAQKAEPVQEKEIVKQRKTEDPFTIGSFNVTVHGLEITDKIEDGYGYFSPDEGNQYAIVSMTVENQGKEAADFLPYYALYGDMTAKLLYLSEYEYSATTLLGYDSDLHGTQLNPLTSKSGVIVFEIPDAVVNGSGSLTLVLSAGSASEEVIVR